MSQATDPQVPLLERLRFICITSSNLDEFFEVRLPASRSRCARRPTRSRPTACRCRICTPSWWTACSGSCTASTRCCT
ncbi:hypothetical protein PUT90_28285, partial [Klebsiella pneumoniae]|uniref:hypothetical protein n=1 Tax=Klebsiella pneumoniae TaxID=573 RepID=UPI002365718A